MAYKILTKKGIENTNIDGARENFFNSGMRDGIVKGAFNEGKFLSNSSNSIYLDSCELRIAGHRIVIDEPAYKTFSNIPSKDTRYSMIAQILVSESADVEFSLFVQSAETVLIKDNLYATGTGQGTYQVEIGRFTLTDKGTVEDVVKTIDNITGTTESIAGGINIGNVTTEKIDYKFDAEVDVTQRYDSDQKKTFTDFNFQIPTQYPVDLDAVEKSVEEAKTNANSAVNTANSAKALAEQAQQQTSELEIKKADRTEIPDTSSFVKRTGDTMTGALAVNSETKLFEDESTWVSASFPEGTFTQVDANNSVKLSIPGLKANAKSTLVTGSAEWSQFGDYYTSIYGTLPLTVVVGSVDDYGEFTLELKDITEDGVLEVVPRFDQGSGNTGYGGPLSLDISFKQTIEGTSDISTERISATTVFTDKTILGAPTSTLPSDAAARKDYVDSEILKVQNKIPDTSSFITSSALPTYMKKYFSYSTPTRTALFTGNAGGGDITLSDSWKNYDMLQVQMAWDAGTNMTSAYYPTWILKTALSEQSAESKDGVMICPGENYWSIKTTSTGTTLYVFGENGMIRNIYGIKFS